MSEKTKVLCASLWHTAGAASSISHLGNPAHFCVMKGGGRSTPVAAKVNPILKETRKSENSA